jgi:hypothetical protein
MYPRTVPGVLLGSAIRIGTGAGLGMLAHKATRGNRRDGPTKTAAEKARSFPWNKRDPIAGRNRPEYKDDKKVIADSTRPTQERLQAYRRTKLHEALRENPSAKTYAGVAGVLGALGGAVGAINAGDDATTRFLLKGVEEGSDTMRRNVRKARLRGGLVGATAAAAIPALAYAGGRALTTRERNEARQELDNPHRFMVNARKAVHKADRKHRRKLKNRGMYDAGGHLVKRHARGPLHGRSTIFLPPNELKRLKGGK